MCCRGAWHALPMIVLGLTLGCATITYIEPDGDREKLTLVRQDGGWRFTLPMPRGTLP
jgi:hypothetical protein